MSGWIKLHRGITSHWIWEDPVKLKWWLDLIMLANHEDKKVNIGMQLIECKRGQSVMSLSSYGKRWKVTKDKARSFFSLLESDGMITRENITKTTRITICNYDDYQDTSHDNQTQTKRKLDACSTLAHPNKNDKNDKNVKNISSDASLDEEYDFENIWALYGRKGNKKTSKRKWDGLPKKAKKLAVVHIPLYVNSTPDLTYRKNFETYINQEAWNDEIIENNENKHEKNKRSDADIDRLKWLAKYAEEAFKE